MTIITKGMGAIIKGITKGTKTRKVPLKKKKKSLLDVTPRKVIKSVAKDVKAVGKNKTLVTGAIAGSINEVLKKDLPLNEKKK
jgi:hypothetical protein